MDLQQNKESAIAFYRMAYLGNPQQAVDQYVGDHYIQHNPRCGRWQRRVYPILPKDAVRISR